MLEAAARAAVAGHAAFAAAAAAAVTAHASVAAAAASATASAAAAAATVTVLLQPVAARAIEKNAAINDRTTNPWFNIKFPSLFLHPSRTMQILYIPARKAKECR